MVNADSTEPIPSVMAEKANGLISGMVNGVSNPLWKTEKVRARFLFVLGWFRDQRRISVEV